MEIIIKSLHVVNFKGMRELTLDFTDAINCVYGANGTGKTTVCDAIQWCLFGKSSTGSTNFAIKTRNEDGSVTPGEEHSVTLTLSIDSISRVIKRKYVEVWESVRGAEPTLRTHKTEYLVDGEKYTKSDFEKFISSIINETTFRIITSPTYFFSLKWQEQRTILQQLAGDVTIEEINASGEFDDIEDILKTKQFASVEQYLQHLSYNINEIKKQLDVIPARIEEQRATMPEQLDFAIVENEVKELQGKLNALMIQQSELKSGKEDATRGALRKQIEFANTRIDQMRKSAQRMSDEAFQERSIKIREYKHNVEEVRSRIAELENKISSLITIENRIIEQQQHYENDIAEIRVRWADMKKMEFHEGDVDDCCPTCGAPLSPDTYRQAVQKALADFTQQKDAVKKELNEWASKVKERQNEANDELASTRNLAEETKVLVAKQKEELANKEHLLAECEAEEVKTAQQLLDINPSYRECKNKIEEYEKELVQTTPVIDTEALTKLNNEIAETEDAIDKKQMALGTQKVIKAHQDRLNELYELQSSLTKQLDSLEAKRDIATDYQFRACDLLEEKVNRHFKNIRFTMFKEYLNTNREPWCSAEKDGVPYSDINAASKLNAGLEVCHVIGNYYDKHASIIIDNAESVNDIYDTKTQQIRLYVSEDKKITIK